LQRVVVGTDLSATAERAVNWAATLADRYDAELVLVQVITDRRELGEGLEYAETELSRAAVEVAGPKARARVVVDADPAAAIVRIAVDEDADVIVVGNAGMSGRKQFLLANVPNRISHMATCTVIIVNSAVAVEADVRRTSSAFDTDAESHVEMVLTGRAADIARVMVKHGFAELNALRDGGDDRTEERARRLRLAFEELGPTFCKLGQILSTRPDLLPGPFIEELATLRDRVPPLTEAEIVQAMEQELRVPWEDVFDSIESEPLAAGTIAQVHRATLASGERVVVKVQRPNARDQMMRDVGLLELFARRSAARPALRQIIDLQAMVDHLSSSLLRELDFAQEASNMHRMREVIATYPRLGVPIVYEDLSTPRLLVMEEIQGAPISEAPVSPARQEAARQLIESYYSQVLTEGFFHADPHPGNLLWWNECVYFLDFGMVGEVGQKLRADLTLLLLAFWREDERFLTDITLTLAGDDASSEVDLDALQAELGGLMSRFRHLPLREMQLGPILQQLTEIAMRHGVTLPASLLLTAKAFAQVQLSATALDPELDPFSVAGRYMAKATLHRFREALDPQMLVDEAHEYLVRIADLVLAFQRGTGARPEAPGAVPRHGRPRGQHPAGGTSPLGRARRRGYQRRGRDHRIIRRRPGVDPQGLRRRVSVSDGRTGRRRRSAGALVTPGSYVDSP